MSDKLLPCQFCDGKPYWREHTELGCSVCDVIVNAVVGVDDVCNCHAPSPRLALLEKVAEAAREADADGFGIKACREITDALAALDKLEAAAQPAQKQGE
jgi:hypothetical protein